MKYNAFQYFPNKNHESFEIFYYLKLFTTAFRQNTEYLKPILKSINLGTNIKIIPVCSVTRSVNSTHSNPNCQVRGTRQLKKIVHLAIIIHFHLLLYLFCYKFYLSLWRYCTFVPRVRVKATVNDKALFQPRFFMMSHQ